MIPMRITWVYEPPRLPPAPNQVTPQTYARFVDEVGRRAGVDIPLVEGFLRDVAPADGFILLKASAHPGVALDECDVRRQADIASRLIPIDVDRTRILETLLEALSIPAAIDLMSLDEWETKDPATIGAWGLHGRKDIGELVGASCKLYKSARYCYLHSPTHHGLPHLLADYLAALARTTAA